MNISLALVKARQVCRVVKDNDCWEVEVPIDLSDLESEAVRHMCDSYKEAVNWCAQAVARVAVLQKFPKLNEWEKHALFRAMYNKQIRDGVSAVEIARFGVQYAQGHFNL